MDLKCQKIVIIEHRTTRPCRLLLLPDRPRSHLALDLKEIDLVALPIILRHARELSKRVMLNLERGAQLFGRLEPWRPGRRGRLLAGHTADELGL